MCLRISCLASLTIMSNFIFAPSSLASARYKILLWYNKPGDHFLPGQPLLAIQTAQSVQEILAETKGILSSIYQPVGAEVSAGQILAQWEKGFDENTPFTRSKIRAVQTELMKNERRFGNVDSKNRSDPPEVTAENSQQATAGSTLASHPLLANSQMWAGMAENDSWVANSDTLQEFFETHPELVNDPKLRMQLENAKRNENTLRNTARPTPFGG